MALEMTGSWVTWALASRDWEVLGLVTWGMIIRPTAK